MGTYRCSSSSTAEWLVPFPALSNWNNYPPVHVRPGVYSHQDCCFNGMALQPPLRSASAPSQPMWPTTCICMEGSMMTPPVIPPRVQGAGTIMMAPPPPPPQYYSQAMPPPTFPIRKYNGPASYRRPPAQAYPAPPYPAANGTYVAGAKPAPVGSSLLRKKRGFVPSAPPGRNVSSRPLGNGRFVPMYDPWNGGFKFNGFGISGRPGGVHGAAPDEGDLEEGEVKKNTGEGAEE